MRTLFPTIIALGLILVACSRTARGPLTFQSPTGWKVEHQTPGGLDFYTVTGKTPDEGLLMFSQWPPPSSPEDTPALVQKLADGFLEQAKKSSKFTLTSEDYRVEQFAGENCQGNFAVFQVGSGGRKTVQAMFMMSVAGRVWNGQFTGPPDAWKQALTVLKSIKKDG
jgi:hypothetical protein